MDVHLGFAHFSLPKLTIYIAQYGLQTTEFWLSRHFGITGNISKQPKGPVRKAFLVIGWVFRKLLPFALHQVCRFLLSYITLHLGPSPKSPSSISASPGGKSQAGRSPIRLLLTSNEDLPRPEVLFSQKTCPDVRLETTVWSCKSWTWKVFFLLVHWLNPFIKIYNPVMNV